MDSGLGMDSGCDRFQSFQCGILGAMTSCILERSRSRRQVEVFDSGRQ